MKIITSSYLKENMAEIVRDMPDTLEPIGITHNGEVKLIVQNPYEYKAREDALTMMMILNFTEQQIKNGEYEDFETVFDELLNHED
ncbi:MAG: type II toxin-antitoxin system Phd/YefM family antitoxin [Deferribacteraceae bacterium]|jgi:hypothetical protein|nr:type II toxin-antitoxin system Phd/YefM family antitoxin [Deferribacteraceae bacterium]